MKRSQLIARIILSPWVVCTTLVWGFFFVVFLIPPVAGTILEWLTNMAKGNNETFRDAWMLGWKDSLAQGTLTILMNPLR
jgi:hypothetical protein